MKKIKYIGYLLPILVLMFVPYFMGVSMQSSTTEINGQKTADQMYAVLQANRVVYENPDIEGLSREGRAITAPEHWVRDKKLPIAGQLVQLSSIELANNATDINYSLQSLWAINQDNFPQSNKEREGLIYILKNPGKNYYTTVQSSGRKYFMAVYPDNAVSPACIQCHNHHKDSPKKDFQVGDLMGGVVLRIPL